MLDTRLNYLSLVAEACRCTPQRVAQFPQFAATHVLQRDPLQLLPDSLIWMQFRRVPRQPLSVHALGSSFSQKVFNWLASRDRCAIPQHQQLARNMPQHMLEEAHHSGPFVRSLVHLQQHTPIWRQRADDRAVVVA